MKLGSGPTGNAAWSVNRIFYIICLFLPRLQPTLYDHHGRRCCCVNHPNWRLNMDHLLVARWGHLMWIPRLLIVLHLRLATNHELNPSPTRAFHSYRCCCRMLLATFSTKAFFEAFYRVCLILTIFYLYIRKQATQLVKTESAFPPEKILWVFVTYQIKYFRWNTIPNVRFPENLDGLKFVFEKPQLDYVLSLLWFCEQIFNQLNLARNTFIKNLFYLYTI